MELFLKLTVIMVIMLIERKKDLKMKILYCCRKISFNSLNTFDKFNVDFTPQNSCKTQITTNFHSMRPLGTNKFLFGSSAT
jgi:hypothetical protein